MSLAQRAATEQRAYDNARRDEAAATIADLTERLHRERVLRKVAGVPAPREA